MTFGSAPISDCGKVTPTCTLNLLSEIPQGYRAALHSDLRRIPLPRTPVNRPEATLKALDASRALRPTQGRSLLPPPSHPAPPCSASVQRTPCSLLWSWCGDSAWRSTG